MKKKTIIVIIIAAVCIKMLIGRGFLFPNTASTIEKSENFTTIDTSLLEVEINDYNITSTPIGIGEYSINVHSNNAELSINVLKNTNLPWCGAVTIEWELFDIEGKSIGKAVGKSASLQMGKSANITVPFKLNSNGKLTYNQKEIKKIILVSVSEEDDLHRFLSNIFYSKKNNLKRYLENGNLEMFNLELENMRKEYNRDEFPNENRELDELEVKANASSDNGNKNTSAGTKSTYNDSTENTSSSANLQTSNTKSSNFVKYRKHSQGDKLTKGDKVFIAGKIDNMKITNNRIYACIDNRWYDIRSNIGFYCKDIILQNGGIENGCAIGIAAEFIEYWKTSDNVQFAALNGSWFTPASFMNTDGEYVELPVYDGKDINSVDIT